MEQEPNIYLGCGRSRQVSPMPVENCANSSTCVFIKMATGRDLCLAFVQWRQR